MAMTTVQKNNTLNTIFRNGSSTLYIGLSKTAPTDSGSNCTEPTASSYERLAVPANNLNWVEPANGSISNYNALRFTEAQEPWTSSASPITHWAIFDNATNGNMLFYGSLLSPREITTGAIFEIPERALITTIIND